MNMCSSPSDKERVAEYEAGPYKGFADDIIKSFASIVPPEADVSAVAEAIVRVGYFLWKKTIPSARGSRAGRR